MVVCPDGEESSVATAVVDEEGGRLLGGIEAMHDLHPEIDHFDRLRESSQVSDVLIQRYLVIFDSWGFGLFRLGLDVVSNALKVGLLVRSKLSK